MRAGMREFISRRSGSPMDHRPHLCRIEVRGSSADGAAIVMPAVRRTSAARPLRIGDRVHGPAKTTLHPDRARRPSCHGCGRLCQRRRFNVGEAGGGGGRRSVSLGDGVWRFKGEGKTSTCFLGRGPGFFSTQHDAGFDRSVNRLQDETHASHGFETRIGWP